MVFATAVAQRDGANDLASTPIDHRPAPRQASWTGRKRFHLILMDNGRSQLLGTAYREELSASAAARA